MTNKAIKDYLNFVFGCYRVQPDPITEAAWMSFLAIHPQSDVAQALVNHKMTSDKPDFLPSIKEISAIIESTKRQPMYQNQPIVQKHVLEQVSENNERRLQSLIKDALYLRVAMRRAAYAKSIETKSTIDDCLTVILDDYEQSGIIPKWIDGV